MGKQINKYEYVDDLYLDLLNGVIQDPTGVAMNNLQMSMI